MDYLILADRRPGIDAIIKKLRVRYPHKNEDEIVAIAKVEWHQTNPTN